MESNSNSSGDDYKINTHMASTEANQYITTTIESLYQCFQRDYHDCPIFYVGSLQNACDEAFSSTLTEECRPVLVYIQHDKSDTLIRAQEKSTRGNVLDELTVFKEECDENERILSFDFLSKTGLCWDSRFSY
ncbi:unnamed protein product [Rotaria sordida]|uniref:Fas-associated factor 1/2-like UAS domain-containing protein n=1 Tax=Rotaria sordida TaxID=392033 RepID=A0A815B1Y8_9BILA|nr:unnamed protein product [Rotaria sordida]CAF1542892.1 unnamed protein product [Rotaria sordida]